MLEECNLFLSGLKMIILYFMGHKLIKRKHKSITSLPKQLAKNRPNKTN